MTKRVLQACDLRPKSEQIVDLLSLGEQERFWFTLNQDNNCEFLFGSWQYGSA